MEKTNHPFKRNSDLILLSMMATTDSQFKHCCNGNPEINRKAKARFYILFGRVDILASDKLGKLG
jgi:hypothetical protein